MKRERSGIEGVAGASGVLTRREVLRRAAIGVVAAGLPAGLRAQVPAMTEAAAHAALGYWRGGVSLNGFAAVRPGWSTPCASRTSVCVVAASDELVAADAITGSPGSYRVRVLGMDPRAGISRALRLRALYGQGVVHETWSAWPTAHGLATSSPTSIRWTAAQGALDLPLQLVFDCGVVRQALLPPREGVFVLPATPDASPSWRRVGLRPRDAQRPLALQLVSRTSGAAIAQPYLLLVVERRPDRHVEPA